MEDQQLKARSWAGVVDFQRLIGLHAPDASLHEHPDFVASIVPAVSASILNAAIPRSADGPALPVDEIVSVYAGTAKWGVWLDADDTANAQALQAHGLVLDSNPVLMVVELADVDLDDAPTAEPATLDEVGRVNDLAYGFPEPRLRTVLSRFPDGVFDAYGAQGRCVAVVRGSDGDAFVTFVATVPEARRSGLASTLLKGALKHASDHGCTTTSLQASKAGQGVYAALGYRPLSEMHLWEKRP